MKLSGPKIENSVIFSQKNVFLIFQQNKRFSPKLKKLLKFHVGTFRIRKKNPLRKQILHLKKWNFLAPSLKNSYIFSKKTFLYFKRELEKPGEQKLHILSPNKSSSYI